MNQFVLLNHFYTIYTKGKKWFVCVHTTCTVFLPHRTLQQRETCRLVMCHTAHHFKMFSEKQVTGCKRGLALRWVDLNEVLQFSGVTGDRAAAVGFHIHINAAVTEDIARGGQHCGVGARPPAQRTVPAVGAQQRFFVVIGGHGSRILASLLLLQVERRRRSRQGGEGFHSVLVLRRIPPLQELQEEDAQGEGGGEGDSHAPCCLWHQPPRPLHQARKQSSNALRVVYLKS